MWGHRVAEAIDEKATTKGKKLKKIGIYGELGWQLGDLRKSLLNYCREIKLRNNFSDSATFLNTLKQEIKETRMRDQSVAKVDPPEREEPTERCEQANGTK